MKNEPCITDLDYEETS